MIASHSIQWAQASSSLSLRLLNKRQSQDNWKLISLMLTLSSEDLMNYWLVSVQIPCSTSWPQNSNFQFSSPKLLKVSVAGALLCFHLSKMKWSSWEKDLWNKPRWPKSSKYAVKWWLSGLVKEKQLAESVPCRWNVSTPYRSIEIGKSTLRFY